MESIFLIDCLIAVTGIILGAFVMWCRYHPSNITLFIWSLRDKRITFSIHDSIGMGIGHLWMDMWLA